MAIINSLLLTVRASTLDVKIYRRQILTSKIDSGTVRVNEQTGTPGQI